jgi:hypothetical protein
VTVNWLHIFNDLFDIIDSDGEAYFSGARFIEAVQTVDPTFPDYDRYVSERTARGESTRRKDYYYEILMELDEADRVRLLNAIVGQVAHLFPDRALEIQETLGAAPAAAPAPARAEPPEPPEAAKAPAKAAPKAPPKGRGKAAAPPARPQAGAKAGAWSAARLAKSLGDLDAVIEAGDFPGAVALGHACLEGFLRAFVKARVPGRTGPDDLVALAGAVRAALRDRDDAYPDEALDLLVHVAELVDRADKRSSRSHFEDEAGRWLAVFIRDLIDAEVRLLLRFL